MRQRRRARGREGGGGKGEEGEGKDGDEAPAEGRGRGGGGEASSPLLSLSTPTVLLLPPVHRFAELLAADTNTVDAAINLDVAINAAGRERRGGGGEGADVEVATRRGGVAVPVVLLPRAPPRHPTAPTALSSSRPPFRAPVVILLPSSSHRPDAHSILINAEYKEGRGRS